MTGSKQPKVKGVSSSDKENHPPKKSARTFSIGTLFASKELQRRNSQLDARDALAPRSSGVAQTGAANVRFDTRLRKSKRAANHPLFRSFVESANSYRKGVLDNVEHQLEPICKELLARVDGLNIHGQPLLESDRSQSADIEDSVARGAQLSRPLEDEIITVQRRKKDGTCKAYDIKLGAMMQNFETLLERTEAKVKNLRKQIHEVDLEISAAYQDILNVERNEAKKARRKLAEDLEALTDEAREAKEQTLTEIKQARDEENTAGEEEKRKLNALLNS